MFTFSCTLVRIFSYALQALAPSQEKLQARRNLRRRIRAIIRSYTEHEFDVEDISMWKYAEDVDIAPLDLIIVVRTIIHRYSSYFVCGQLTVCLRPFVSCRTRYVWRHTLLTTIGQERILGASPWHRLPQFT